VAQIELPRTGIVNLFSVHTGWWDDEEEPFQNQYRNLLAWAAEIAEPRGTTIFCGDFNVAAGSKMQEFMTNGTGYSDQYALANADGLRDATIDGAIDGWESADGGQRIDYILMNDDSPLRLKRHRSSLRRTGTVSFRTTRESMRVLIGARMYRPRFARARYSASRFCRTYG
jgi:maltose 6'-phosphate phosphatase